MQIPTPHNPEHYSDQIARLAYELWDQAGRPIGRDLEFWFNAEHRLATTVKPAAASSVSRRAKSSPGVATAGFVAKSHAQIEGIGKPMAPAITHLPARPQKRNNVASHVR
jgi:hypothetical protein